jgi:hypothetical protein
MTDGATSVAIRIFTVIVGSADSPDAFLILDLPQRLRVLREDVVHATSFLRPLQATLFKRLDIKTFKSSVRPISGKHNAIVLYSKNFLRQSIELMAV